MSEPCYQKTAKGRSEISTGQHRLPVLARRLLLLADGQRSVTELAQACGNAASSAQAMLLALQADGFLEQAGATRPALTGAPPAEAAWPALAPAQLAELRQLMTDSCHALLGLMGQPLLRRIEAATDEQALRSCAAHWRQALCERRQKDGVQEDYLLKVQGLLRAAQ